MDAGALRHKIVIQRQTAQSDEIGNRTNSWEDYFQCHAGVSTFRKDESTGEVRHDSEVVTFSIRSNRLTQRITSTEFRVIFRGITFNIRSVDQMNYDLREIRLRCEREVRS